MNTDATLKRMGNWMARAACLAGIFLCASGFLVLPTYAAETQGEYAQINVVEESTGQPIPMVKLIFHNGMIFYTDNQGIAAVRIPGLMGEQVRVVLRSPSPGYPGDFFLGGAHVVLRPDGSDTITIERRNLAERLYRVTGMGLYRDSKLVGADVPIEDPLSNLDVISHGLGNQAVFKGKLYWFWDGHSTLRNPIPNLKLSGATSELPSSGGLDPRIGINLDYVTGFFGVRRLLRIDENVQAVKRNVFVTEDSSGEQVLHAYYQLLDDGSRVEHGILLWDESGKQFKIVKEFPSGMKVRVCRNTIRIQTEGREWFYLTCPHPIVRVPARPDLFQDPSRYETFAPLDEEGNWGWQTQTETITNRDQPQLLESTSMTREDGLFHLTDVRTGQSILGMGGTVNWNEYRDKWIMVFTEALGRSKHGEVWYAEADSPLGPWVYARRIATHRQSTRFAREFTYAFPKLHSYFQKQKGETVFFSGTFGKFLTESAPVPRYEMNEMMYGLDVTQRGLFLPTAVYEYRDDQDRIQYGTRKNTTQSIRSSPTVRYYALPPDRPSGESVPVWLMESTDSNGNSVVRLTTDSDQVASDVQPVFYALSVDTVPPNPAVEDLFEYKNQETGKLLYAPADQAPEGDQWSLNRGPVVKVWSSPRVDPPTDPYSKPVKKCIGASAHC